MLDKVLSLPEAAKVLELTRFRVFQLVQAGTLPAERLGRFWYVKSEDIRKYVIAKWLKKYIAVHGHPPTSNSEAERQADSVLRRGA